MNDFITEIEYNDPIIFNLCEELSGERIDKILSSLLKDYSRSFIQKLFDDNLVLCNNITVTKSFKPKTDDIISFIIQEPVSLDIKPENISLDIRYEDDHLLIVNKPKGMVVHPAPGNYSNTLVNALLYYCKGNLSGINGVIRPGIVHRIDKDTSGLLLVAKTDIAHNSLSAQIKEHSLDREYRAVVHGKFKELSGVIDAPIGRSPVDRKKMCVTDKNSKNAVTHYEVLEEFDSYSLIKCVLETGRTHQIRVHMSYKGHPVAGDQIYGFKNKNIDLNGQCLHAGLLGFTHPVTNERIVIQSELPEYFNNFLRRIK